MAKLKRVLRLDTKEAQTMELVAPSSLVRVPGYYQWDRSGISPSWLFVEGIPLPMDGRKVVVTPQNDRAGEPVWRITLPGADKPLTVPRISDGIILPSAKEVGRIMMNLRVPMRGQELVVLFNLTTVQREQGKK